MPGWPPSPSTIESLRASVRYNLGGFSQLRTYVDSNDVLQNVLLRLLAAVEKARPPTQADLLALAARHIRWELLSLYRTHFGPEGPGNKVATLSHGAELQGDLNQTRSDPHAALALAEAVDKLPPEHRQVVDLLFYNELSHEEAAELLGVSSKTIQRRFRDARVALGRLLA